MDDILKNLENTINVPLAPTSARGPSSVSTFLRSQAFSTSGDSIVLSKIREYLDEASNLILNVVTTDKILMRALERYDDLNGRHDGRVPYQMRMGN